MPKLNHNFQISEKQKWCPICKQWHWRGGVVPSPNPRRGRAKPSDDHPCHFCKDTFAAKVWMYQEVN